MATHDEPIAQRVPGYLLRRQVREDACSLWYDAEQAAAGRPVTVRALKPRAPENVAAAFMAEVERLAALRHPNLSSVLDRVAAPPALVTEPMGRTLADELAAGWPLGEAVALRYGRDLASALHYLAAHGLAHRNVSPGLVHLMPAGGRLLTPGEVVPLKALAAQRGRLTQDPRYVAPEQVAGTAPVDSRAGTYQVGALLFHMLAGRPPHPASSPLEMVRAHLHDEFPRLDAVRPDANPAVADFCAACAARDPALRPGLADVVHRLGRLLAHPGKRAR